MNICSYGNESFVVATALLLLLLLLLLLPLLLAAAAVVVVVVLLLPSSILILIFNRSFSFFVLQLFQVLKQLPSITSAHRKKAVGQA